MSDWTKFDFNATVPNGVNITLGTILAAMREIEGLPQQPRKSHPKPDAIDIESEVLPPRQEPKQLLEPKP